MKLNRCIVATLLLAPIACAAPEEPASPPANETTEVEMNAKAVELSKRFLLVDTHIDVPYRLEEKPADVGDHTDGGDFDFPRAVAGGLDVSFMSIYTPASYQEAGGAKDFADELIDTVEGIVAQNPDKFTMVVNADEAAAILGTGKLGFALGIENGAPIEGDLANLKHFHDRGVRYITLTHSENNHICDSSYADADDREWNGLSPFGRELVAAMNDVGMMIDVSHVSDAAFEQVIDLSRAPVIASHSSLRHFTPGWERNMTDAMVAAMRDNGGVVQINFGSAFLNQAAHEQGTTYWKALRTHMTEQGLERGSAEMEAWEAEYWADRTKLFADVSDVADHIDRVVELAGIDHVGLGSDFDGVGDSLPTGLKDVSQYPNLIAVLLERGYSEEDIEKVCGGNLMRVWREVERIAAE